MMPPTFSPRLRARGVERGSERGVKKYMDRWKRREGETRRRRRRRRRRSTQSKPSIGERKCEEREKWIKRHRDSGRDKEDQNEGENMKIMFETNEKTMWLNSNNEIPGYRFQVAVQLDAEGS
jgi:hypothetical protein